MNHQHSPAGAAGTYDVRLVGVSVGTRLHDVSMTVPAGAKFGVIGPSGAGKTTLISLITGMVTPAAGTVDIAAEIIGYIPQDPGSTLAPHRTVAESILEPQQIRLAREPRARRAEELSQLRAQIPELLTSLGLSAEMADRYPSQLSGGQRQRVAIARALLGQPQLIIADEAFSALDTATAALLQDLLRKHRATVVFVSHNIPALLAMCDTIAVLIDGTCRYLGPVDGLAAVTDADVVELLDAAEVLRGAVPRSSTAGEKGGAQ